MAKPLIYNEIIVNYTSIHLSETMSLFKVTSSSCNIATTYRQPLIFAYRKKYQLFESELIHYSFLQLNPVAKLYSGQHVLHSILRLCSIVILKQGAQSQILTCQHVKRLKMNHFLNAAECNTSNQHSSELIERKRFTKESQEQICALGKN